MNERPVEIVTVNVGDKFPDVYVRRLRSMLGRNFSRPFSFTCFNPVRSALIVDDPPPNSDDLIS